MIKTIEQYLNSILIEQIGANGQIFKNGLLQETISLYSIGIFGNKPNNDLEQRWRDIQAQTDTFIHAAQYHNDTALKERIKAILLAHAELKQLCAATPDKIGGIDVSRVGAWSRILSTIESVCNNLRILSESDNTENNNSLPIDKYTEPCLVRLFELLHKSQNSNGEAIISGRSSSWCKMCRGNRLENDKHKLTWSYTHKGKISAKALYDIMRKINFSHDNAIIAMGWFYIDITKNDIKRWKSEYNAGNLSLLLIRKVKLIDNILNAKT